MSFSFSKTTLCSFLHTITSSFSHVGTTPSCFLNFCLRYGLALLFFIGAMIALFSIATMKMLIIAIGIGIFLYLFRKKLYVITHPIDSIAHHPATSLCLVICIGLLFRILFYYIKLGTVLEAYQPGDCQIFFNEAKEMAAGSFPETKSWVTVGCYALLIKLFGESYFPLCILNMILQIACLLLLYLVGRRMFNSFSALLATMAFYWSPHFISIVFQLYIEHFYFTLVLFQFLLLYLWTRKRNVLYFAIMGLTILITLWTKTEAGIFLIIISIFFFLANAILSYHALKSIIIGGVIMLLVIICGLYCSYSLNQKYHKTSTCLCSKDGYWPQYFGANYANQGKAKNEDKLALYETYYKETGIRLEFRPNHCPAVLVPYIQAEIRRRWSAMSLKEKIHHVYVKEAYSWQMIDNPRYDTELIPKFHTIFKVFIWLSACMALLLLSYGVLSCPSTKQINVFRILPILYLLGMFLCIMVVESNFRYSTCANVFFPLYFGFFINWIKCKNQ